MTQPQGIQDRMLNQLRKDRLSVSIHMVNGYQINHAMIAGYDNFVVLIEHNGRQSMLYKHAISTITPEAPMDLAHITKGQ